MAAFANDPVSIWTKCQTEIRLSLRPLMVEVSLSFVPPLPASRNLTGGCLRRWARYMKVVAGIPCGTGRFITVELPLNTAV